jgi:hypothetical protein
MRCGAGVALFQGGETACDDYWHIDLLRKLSAMFQQEETET